MTRRSEQLSPELHDYLVASSSPVDPVLAGLAAETAERFPADTGMQIGPEQGHLMTILSRLAAPRLAVEVGTFTGYSSICLARGLAPGGRLLCCDVSEEWTAVARRYWERAGVADRVDLRLAPALDTLRSLPEDTVIDLAFIDADKAAYTAYWDEIVPRLRPGGIVLADNTFSHGRVVDPFETGPAVQGIRDFNARAAADTRVDTVLLPIGDGLTLSRRR